MILITTITTNKFAKYKRSAYIGRLFLVSGFLLIFTFCITGCSIIPEEEAVHAMPVISTEQTEEYALEAVHMGDVTKTQSVTCTYTQVTEEEVSFPMTGKEIEQVFVETGDTVKKGDILATLYLDDLKDELTQLNNTLEMNTLLLAQANEREQFERTRRELRADEELPMEIQKQYKEEKETYSDQIYITNKKIETVQAEIAKGTLYAGMDGVVSFVRANLTGADSIAQSAVIRIMDEDQCAFCTEDMEYADLFIPGESVTVVVGNEEYETTVEAFDETSERIMFKPNDTVFDISVGARGIVTVELASKKDVKVLSLEAIHQAEDMYYVYCLDDNGVRRMQEIEVGFIGDGIAEITNGLDYDDEVIK